MYISQPLSSTGPPEKLIWVLFAIGCGIGSLLLGQDANWDLRNYHLYIPHAFLTGRLDWDIAPSQVANFYNPLLYIPFYYAVLSLPPKVFGFTVGFIQGLNAWMIGGIAQESFKSSGIPSSRITICLLALLGITGSGFVSEIGTSFSDTLLSLMVFGSLWMNLISLGQHHEGKALIPWKPLMFSGLLMGLSSGLKQPTVIYAVGLCLAVPFTARRFHQGVLIAFLFGIGVLAGIAISGGFWMHEMWSRYGNPLFPYFNDFFHSPWASPGSYRDTRFLPGSFWEAVIFPLNFGFFPRKTAEISFRDFRILVFYILMVVFGLYLLLRSIHETEKSSMEPTCRHGRYLFLFGAFSFLIWLKLFGIYRYLIVLEMLAPLGIWWIWQRLFADKPVFLKWGTVACAAFLLFSTQPGDWERVPWGKDYFGVTPPPLENPDNTLILMAGNEPMGYLIPFFTKSVRFLRIQSYFTGPSASINEFDRKMQAIVKNHKGDMYLFYKRYEEKGVQEVLDAYGLVKEDTLCHPFRPHIESHLYFPLQYCKLKPISQKGV